MKKITFSIITPTYNRLKTGYLESCIKSISTQNDDNLEYEHIIINDGSTDGTEVYLKNICEKYPNIQIISKKKNEGVAKAYKTGIKKAKNEYIIFIDDDDLLPKNSLMLRADFARKNPEFDWFYGKARWIDDKGKLKRTNYQSRYYNSFRYERLLVNNYIHNGTPTIKTEPLKKINWPAWLYKSQDYFLWLELMRPRKNLKVGFLDEKIFTYRIHPGRFMSSLREKSVSEKFHLNRNKIRNKLHPKGLVFLETKLNKATAEKLILKKKMKNLK